MNLLRLRCRSETGAPLPRALGVGERCGGGRGVTCVKGGVRVSQPARGHQTAFPTIRPKRARQWSAGLRPASPAQRAKLRGFLSPHGALAKGNGAATTARGYVDVRFRGLRPRCRPEAGAPLPRATGLGRRCGGGRGATCGFPAERLLCRPPRGQRAQWPPSGGNSYFRYTGLFGSGCWTGVETTAGNRQGFGAWLRSEQQFLQVWSGRSLQRAPQLDGRHDRRLDAASSDDLRALGDRLPDQFTEPRPGGPDLPSVVHRGSGAKELSAARQPRVAWRATTVATASVRRLA